MKKIQVIIMAAMCLLSMGCGKKEDEGKAPITKPQITIEGGRLTPEGLWAMGRVGSVQSDIETGLLAYTVSYYSVEENRSTTWIRVCNPFSENGELEVCDEFVGYDPAWFGSSGWLAYLRSGQLYLRRDKEEIKVEGAEDVEGFLLSPMRDKIILIKSIKTVQSTVDKYPDLPLATGHMHEDLMYKHWDEWTETAPQPFVCPLELTWHGEGERIKSAKVGEGVNILEGTPYECPMKPFGGIEQLAWSPDSKFIAFTCRCLTGIDYSISTDSDIFLYDVESGDMNQTKNLCKNCGEFDVVPDGGFVGSPDNICNPTKTLKDQFINTNLKDYNVGYDFNPKFSPDGKYVAWLSMERDGYEADRQRLCIYNLKENTKTYVTESFDSSVDDFCWAPDSYTLYYIAVWHATENLYKTNLKGEVKQLTNDWADFGSLQMLNDKQVLAERHSITAPADLYVVNPGDTIADTKVTQITEVNKEILDQLAKPSIEQRWVKTTDGLDLLYWVIQPPHFDPNKKYPTLLFCEGGPQSAVSQFWSYRWNFMIMASQGYVVIAPNRRGVPGFGQEWLEEISGDWTGQCMKDYLSAIDDAAENLPYVDKDHMGAVGASFGGFSVYYLAGHHDKRFKCFIAHDGAFNLEAMYTETEENWFSNWEYDDAYWNKDQTARAKKTYENSPHRFVDKWDTPILCIHGEKDYRINATQGMSAFNAARMRGIEAELLIFPDENHWVLKPQNGILWQRTYFAWLDKWLK